MTGLLFKCWLLSAKRKTRERDEHSFCRSEGAGASLQPWDSICFDSEEDHIRRQWLCKWLCRRDFEDFSTVPLINLICLGIVFYYYFLNCRQLLLSQCLSSNKNSRDVVTPMEEKETWERILYVCVQCTLL